MKENFFDGILRNLNKYFGYGIIELKDISDLESSWGAIKATNEHKNIIVFLKKENFHEINLYGRLREQFENIRLIKVIVAEDENYFISINNYLSNMDNVIIINRKEKRILGCSSGLEDVAYELQRSISFIQESESVKKTKKAFELTYAIIAINIIVYMMLSLYSKNFIDIDIDVLVQFGAKYNKFISLGEYYRLITCMFLHGGIAHLALNMYSLYSIGPIVEETYGKFNFILIYFISGITASLFSYLFSIGISVGASGAIFGVLGAVLVYAFNMRKRIGKEFLKNILAVIIANLIIGLSIPNIDNFAHLGGLIGGVIIAAAFNYKK